MKFLPSGIDHREETWDKAVKKHEAGILRLLHECRKIFGCAWGAAVDMCWSLENWYRQISADKSFFHGEITNPDLILLFKIKIDRTWP